MKFNTKLPLILTTVVLFNAPSMTSTSAQAASIGKDVINTSASAKDIIIPLCMPYPSCRVKGNNLNDTSYITKLANGNFN
ncbi:hypothetical protein [Colwellia sp. MEBiC06753]